MPLSPHYRPAPCIEGLKDLLCDPVRAARFPELRLRFRHQGWAGEVGLGELDEGEWCRHFGAFEALLCNLNEPLALRYHGHQFGSYNPQLGDGRGFLFAQLRDGKGRLLDLGTKGSGQTPYSRGGDGRLTLKGGMREILATEMLEALGVETSKTFSLIETGESLWRGDEPSPTRSSVLVRLSHSHIRIGSFQRLEFLEDKAGLRRLLDYCVQHYYPALGSEDLPRAFFRALLDRCAALCASWMIAGFVHGVLNSDNINITGESFDYGPWRFLPHYDAGFTAAYFDETGLYAFGRQPQAMAQNLWWLGRALTLLDAELDVEEEIRAFEGKLNAYAAAFLQRRLGIEPLQGDDPMLLPLTFTFLRESRVSFAGFFHDFRGGVLAEAKAHRGPRAAHYRGMAYEGFRRALEGYRPRADAGLDDPYFQGDEPCDILIDEVEALWAAIATKDDWSALEAKIDAIRHMGHLLRGKGAFPAAEMG